MPTLKQKQRSDRMYQAAMEEFSSRGFHHASVDTIAQKAGVSKATLYSHFATKETLFLAIFDQVLKSTVKPPDIDLRTTPLEEGLRLGFRQLFTKVAGTPEARFFFQCMTSDSDVLGEDLRNELSNRFVATSLGEMRELVQAQADGKIHAHFDLEIIHHAIIGMILQALRFWWSREKQIPVRKLADQLSEFVLHGMAVPAAARRVTTATGPARTRIPVSPKRSTSGKRGKKS